ncbi:MAG: hypothetical protein A2Y66_01860 [Nitrospirae bacterium RBG_13_41_22]|nr:MAG: hypothetical protein A2Y66_01860 [Nitrospirae bacterium RBG_13_41_22]
MKQSSQKTIKEKTVNFGSNIYGVNISEVSCFFKLREEVTINIISEWQNDKNLKVLHQPNLQSDVYLSKAFYLEMIAQDKFAKSFIYDFEVIKKNLINFDREYTKDYIYFLFQDLEIVYIGQTTNFAGRIKQHQKEKDFDSVAILSIYKGYLDIAEMINILEYNPKLNVQKWGPRSYLRHILSMCDGCY